jgi:Arc/MetJ-type ribon-helix-helix transcriptional regulator
MLKKRSGLSNQGGHMNQLSPETEQYIQAQLATGAFKNRYELMEQALLLYKQREEDRKYIRDAVNLGIEQAERGETIAGDQVLDRLERKADALAKRPQA